MISTISWKERRRTSSSPSSSKAARQRAVCRREEFIEAVLRLCEREGLEAITARRIASETQRSPMALYRHYESMEHLVFAAWSELHARTETAIWTAANRASDCADEFRLLFRSFAQLAAERPRLFRFLMNNPACPEGIEQVAQVTASSGRIEDLLRRGQAEGVFRPDLDVHAAALRMLFLMIGAATLVASPRSERYCAEGSRALLELALAQCLSPALQTN